jgi:hypothetical protein
MHDTRRAISKQQLRRGTGRADGRRRERRRPTAGRVRGSLRTAVVVTTAKLASHATVEIHSFENRDGMRACGTLGVDVLLSARPMVVYLAQELDGSPCARTATMEHEMKHVAVFRAALDEAARDLAADLPAVIGTDVQWAKSKAELQRQMNARVTDYLAEFMDQRGRELNERQNGVDSPQEYARVKGACAQ